MQLYLLYVGMVLERFCTAEVMEAPGAHRLPPKVEVTCRFMHDFFVNVSHDFYFFKLDTTILELDLKPFHMVPFASERKAGDLAAFLTLSNRENLPGSGGGYLDVDKSKGVIV